MSLFRVGVLHDALHVQLHITLLALHLHILILARRGGCWGGFPLLLLLLGLWLGGEAGSHGQEVVGEKGKFWVVQNLGTNAITE